MVVAALAQFLDSVSFAVCVVVIGIAGEANPIVRAVGPGGALLAKAGIIAAIPLVDRALRAPWVMAAVTAIGLFGAAANLVALARALA